MISRNGIESDSQWIAGTLGASKRTAETRVRILRIRPSAGSLELLYSGFLWQIVYDFSPTHWNNFHSLISISKLQSSLSAALGVSSKNNFIQTFSTQPFLKILKVEVDGPSRSLSWLATNPVAYFQVGSSNRRSACYWWTAAFELKRIENYGKIS